MNNISSLKTTDFIRAYSGRPGCACGCRGTYYEAGSKMIGRILRKFQAADPSTIAVGPGYLAIDGASRAWVLYTE